MKVGDVVVPRSPDRVLFCGSGTYSHAIVGCLDPFILVSSEGDMIWYVTWQPEEVIALCQASAEIQQVVASRLTRTGEHQRQPRFTCDHCGSADDVQLIPDGTPSGESDWLCRSCRGE